jgi:hypothetical protein
MTTALVMARAASRPVLIASLLLALGCSDRGTHSLTIEGSEQVTAGVTTADQWTVTFSSFVVVVHNPGIIERTDNKPAWVREPGVTVWDVTQVPEEDQALSEIIRATRYDGADFRIAPTSVSGYEAVEGNVESDIVDAANDDGWSIHVVGRASHAMNGTIQFDWTFTTNTFYRCKFEGDSVIELAADGEETTVIEILGEVLIGENFQPIADADADTDGTVTQAEIEGSALWDAIESASMEIGGVRGAGACPIVEE